MFSVSVMILIFFVIFIGIFIFIIVRGLISWHKNNTSPIISVGASIVAKRMRVSGGAEMSNQMHTPPSTIYYVTFEFLSGSRQEFHVHGKEYGLLAEGDSGILTFQGTRYISFERK
ncbi:MAG: DUF2500 domain-containing protein [Oscillospiraceae bacterium]|nr:DUF2500 domain-containing protein [Oscillospiraceae bacterium]